MKVTITHKDAMKFEAKTEKSSFIIDCPTISPVEYFLSVLFPCGRLRASKSGFYFNKANVFQTLLASPTRS